MWFVNFVDGSSLRGDNWDDISGDKGISGLQLVHPHLPKLALILQGYDRYYFTKEALAFIGHQGTVSAEVIGAHDLKLGVGVEVRLEYTGNVKIQTYPVVNFKYSTSILRKGRSNGNKQILTVA